MEKELASFTVGNATVFEVPGSMWLVREPPQRRVVAYRARSKPSSLGLYDIPFPWLYYRMNKNGAIHEIYASAVERTPSNRSHRVLPFAFYNMYFARPCYSPLYFNFNANGKVQEVLFSNEERVQETISYYWSGVFNSDGSYVLTPVWKRIMANAEAKNLAIYPETCSEIWRNYYINGQGMRPEILEELTVDKICEYYQRHSRTDSKVLRRVVNLPID
ncbi:MAG TPA: hypothetical protein VJ742_12880 [Nitrososphaera sp.]|nr:hypothetical protein [Nitrososphaera sp.]